MIRVVLIAITTLLTFSVARAQQSGSADLLITGGPIYTGTETDPQVEAVAIKDGRFLYVGNDADAALLVGPATTILRLTDGAAAFPGFVDAHMHLRRVGERELQLNLDTAKTLDQFKDLIAVWRQENPDAPILVGRGWIETHWPERRFPSRFDIDSIIDDIPVVLGRADGHAVVVNSLALERAGITPRTEAPEGGDILRNALGEPTGLLVDDAQALVSSILPELSEDRRREALILGADIYAQRGWTGVHNMSVAWRDVEMIEQLNRIKKMPIHVYNAVDRSDADKLFDRGIRQSADGRIITKAIKLYADGALGSRGAALLAPYSDDTTDGLLRIDEDNATALMAEALEKDIQISMHAIGDRGNRLTLDWFEAALKNAGLDMSPRWRIEHAQILTPADIPRLSSMGVIASMQPSHAIGDLFFAPDRLGDTRLTGAYAWKSLVDNSTIVAGGTDAPVEVGDPLIEFYAAIGRRALNGFQGENWHPQEAVTRETALKMFTYWPAIASFMEDERGTIEIGKRADVTVFSGDLMTIEVGRIPTLKAIATIVDGVVQYAAE